MAAGPAGKVVGKAVVKVVPDTSDAYGEVKSLVKRLERDGLQIKVGVDTQGARRDVDGLVGDTERRKVSLNVDANTRRAVKAARVTTAQIGKLTPSVELDLDIAEAQAKRARIAADLAALRSQRTSSAVDLDIAEAQAKRRTILVELGELNAADASPRVDAQITAAEVKLARVDARLDELGSRSADPRLDADARLLEAKLARADAQLADMARRKVEIPLSASLAASAAAQVAEAGEEAGDALGAVGDALSGIGSGIGSATEALGELAEKLPAATSKARADVKSMTGDAAEVEVDADTSPARTAALDMDAYIRSLDPQMRVDADASRALTRALVTEAVIGSLDPTMRIDGDATRAITRALTTAQLITGLNPTLRIGADTRPALTRAMAMTAYINSLEARIRVTADTDRRGLAGAGDGADGVSRLSVAFGAAAKGATALLAAGAKLPLLLGSIGTALQGGVQAGTQAFSVFSGLAQSIGGLGRAGAGMAAALFTVPVVIFSVIKSLVAFGAQATAVFLVIGAVTFAVGALGAAVAGLPALLTAAGAAGATVYLGLDGIKKAAGAAKPALDQLKASVSGVFEKTLTPIFEQVGKALPKLDGGFKLLAGSVSGFIGSLLGVTFGTEGIANLNAVLANTRVFVETLTPGVSTLVATLLRVGTAREPFVILGQIVDGLTLKLAELFDRLAEGGESSLMTQGLAQLRNVLLALADVFNELVLGATQFFVSAGPGVTRALEGIRDVIKKIDFKQLGEAFGRFVESAVRFIENIPQSTWDSIAEAINMVATEFEQLSQNEQVQAFFNGLILIIPLAIRAFAHFLDVVRQVVSFLVTGVAVGFAGARVAISGFVLAVATGMSAIVGALRSVLDYLPFIPESWKTNLAGAQVVIDNYKTQAGATFDQSIAELSGKAPAAAAAGGALGEGAANGALAGVGPLPGHMGQAAAGGVGGVNGQAGPAGAAGTGLGASAADGAKVGINPMPGAMGDAAAGGVAGVNGEIGPADAAGNAVGAGAADGARVGITPMPGELADITRQAREGIDQQRSGFRTAGEALSAGVEVGIRAGGSSVISSAVDMAVSAFRAAKNALGIASPSKLFRFQIGAQIGAGMALGIGDTVGLVARSIEALIGATDVQTRGLYRAGLSYGEQIAAGVTTAVRAIDPAGLLGEQARIASRVTSGAHQAASRAPAPRRPGDGQALSAADAALLERAFAAALAAGLRLDTEGGEVIARLAAAGRRALDRR